MPVCAWIHTRHTLTVVNTVQFKSKMWHWIQITVQLYVDTHKTYCIKYSRIQINTVELKLVRNKIQTFCFMQIRHTYFSNHSLAKALIEYQFKNKTTFQKEVLLKHYFKRSIDQKFQQTLSSIMCKYN